MIAVVGCASEDFVGCMRGDEGGMEDGKEGGEGGEGEEISHFHLPRGNG